MIPPSLLPGRVGGKCGEKKAERKKKPDQRLVPSYYRIYDKRSFLFFLYEIRYPIMSKFPLVRVKEVGGGVRGLVTSFPPGAFVGGLVDLVCRWN